MSTPYDKIENHISAKIITRDAPHNWLLVAHGKMKNVNKATGLYLKNKYGFKPYKECGIFVGYTGKIPLHEFGNDFSVID